jgi:hypothetical protein
MMSFPRHQLAVLSFAAWAASACGGSSPAPSFTVRDSAGVRIAENSADDGAVETWDVTPQPTLIIGQREGDPEYLLDRVVAAFRLASGEYVVANAVSAEFFFYDEQGRFLRSAGGRGGGPGEVNRLSDVTLLEGDTLVAFDAYRGQIDFFGPSGEFVRRSSVNFRALFTPPFFFEPFRTHLLADRTILVQADEMQRGSSEGTSRKPLIFERYDPSTGARDSLGTFPGYENFGVEIGGRKFYDGPPAPRSTIETQGPHFVYIADNDRYEISAFDLVSGDRWSIRRDRPGPPFTAEDRAIFETTYLERAERTPMPMADHERWLAVVPSPATWPPIEALRSDRLGRLWVQETSSQTDQPPRWAVFDTGGRLIGEVELPQGLMPFDIGRDYILGVARDEDDVQFVHVYGLTAREDP